MSLIDTNGPNRRRRRRSTRVHVNPVSSRGSIWTPLPTLSTSTRSQPRSASWPYHRKIAPTLLCTSSGVPRRSTRRQRASRASHRG